jgi:adenylate kinase
MDNQELIAKHNEPFKSILIFGPPGSGKGTLGKFLSTAGGHCHLSSGDIFRGLSPDSPGGILFQEYAGKGLLVPDNVTISIWHHYVWGLIATNKYFPSKQYLLLDGLPRNVEQARQMESHIDIAHIIVLKIEDEEKLIQRLTRRAIIEKRSDDTNPEVLKTRFKVYNETTEKLLDHYPKDLISTFNADQKPLEVLRDVLVGFSDVANLSDL